MASPRYDTVGFLSAWYHHDTDSGNPENNFDP